AIIAILIMRASVLGASCSQTPWGLKAATGFPLDQAVPADTHSRSYHRNYVAGRRLLLIRMPAPGTDVLPGRSLFPAQASTRASKLVASPPASRRFPMRLATLLVVLACGCATSSPSAPPSGGTNEPADARERGDRKS